MKYLTLLTTISFITVSLPSAHAATPVKKENSEGRYAVTNLERISINQFDCDELIGLTKKKYLFVGGGQILAGTPLACFDVTSRDFDFYNSESNYIKTSGGFCRVWGCTGIRDNGGRGGS